MKGKIKNEGKPERPVKTFSFTQALIANKEKKERKIEKCLQPRFFGHRPLGKPN